MPSYCVGHNVYSLSSFRQTDMSGTLLQLATTPRLSSLWIIIFISPCNWITEGSWIVLVLGSFDKSFAQNKLKWELFQRSVYFFSFKLIYFLVLYFFLMTFELIKYERLEWFTSDIRIQMIRLDCYINIDLIISPFFSLILLIFEWTIFNWKSRCGIVSKRI